MCKLSLRPYIDIKQISEWISMKGDTDKRKNAWSLEYGWQHEMKEEDICSKFDEKINQ